MSTSRATGALHPITDIAQHPWEIDDNLHAWMTSVNPNYPGLADDRGPFVVIEDQVEGTLIVIPNRLLAVIARGLIAAHVDSGRKDKWS